MFLDFEAIKQANPIDTVIAKLGLEMREHKGQYRGKCPICKKDDKRTLVVTVSDNVFYCFGCEKGGDVLSFVSHIKECGVKEAAQFLNDSPTEQSPTERPKTGMSPLDYLVFDDPLMRDIGFEPEDCEKIGIGYAPKGTLKGCVCIPIRMPDGKLIGYIGIRRAKLPKQWHF